MLDEELAPHVREITRALGDKLSEEEIAEELRKCVSVYGLSIQMAKRTIVKKHGGDPNAVAPAFQRKLAELRPNEPNVDFVAKLLSVNRKEVTAKGEKKTIMYGYLGDDSTTLRWTAWATEGIEDLAKGDVISVKGAYTREYQGRVEVQFGNRASIRKEDPSTITDEQIAAGPPRVATVGQLREGMGYVEVKGRVLSVQGRQVTAMGEPRTVFSGVLADETGKIQFSAWHDFKLKEGEVVKISRATVKSYRGVPQLSFDERAEVIRVKEKFPSAEELQRTSRTMIASVAAKGGAADAMVEGMVIEVREGSGLIMRCPECRRALQKGTCKVHGRVEGYPDLRVKAILDDGTGAVGVVIGRELTERLLDTTLDDCVQKAKQAMSYEVVRDMLEEKLTLRALAVTGNITADAYGLSMIAKDASFAEHDTKAEAEKLLVELEGQE
ncbi:MAG: OB-fold nucleic acid binding domain-containing protein [Thermoplasmata archaeon]